MKTVQIKPYKLTLTVKPSAELERPWLRELTSLCMHYAKTPVLGRVNLDPEHSEDFPRLKVEVERDSGQRFRGMKYTLRFSIFEGESTDQVATDLITFFHEHGWEVS